MLGMLAVIGHATAMRDRPPLRILPPKAVAGIGSSYARYALLREAPDASY